MSPLPKEPMAAVGLGRSPAWSPSGDAIGATLPSAQSSHFVLYPLVEAEISSVGFRRSAASST
jgi:hypothetical protein